MASYTETVVCAALRPVVFKLQVGQACTLRVRSAVAGCALYECALGTKTLRAFAVGPRAYDVEVNVPLDDGSDRAPRCTLRVTRVR